MADARASAVADCRLSIGDWAGLCTCLDTRAYLLAAWGVRPEAAKLTPPPGGFPTELSTKLSGPSSSPSSSQLSGKSRPGVLGPLSCRLPGEERGRSRPRLLGPLLLRSLGLLRTESLSSLLSSLRGELSAEPLSKLLCSRSRAWVLFLQNRQFAGLLTPRPPRGGEGATEGLAIIYM